MSQHDRDLTLFTVRLHYRDELVAMLSVLPADTEATVNWLAEGTTDIWSEKGDERR